MADLKERIIEFDAATGINSDDHLLIDGATAGTRKLAVSTLIGVVPVELTSLQYESLTPEEKEDPKFIYFVSDE